MTSAPPHSEARERFVIEKLMVDGKEGWFITEFLETSAHGIIQE